MRDLLTTPTAVFALVQNRVECHSVLVLYDNCKQKRCILVSLAVPYQSVKRAIEVYYLTQDEYVAFPTDILLGNINGMPRA